MIALVGGWGKGYITFTTDSPSQCFGRTEHHEIAVPRHLVEDPGDRP